MIDKKKDKKKSQSILDFVLAFIAIALLSVGIVRIWVWFNANYASRQVAYQRSRIVAGKPQTLYTEPVDTGATEVCPECTYQPLNLTEEWVFRGEASGTVLGGGAGTVLPPEVIAQACQEWCLAQPGSGCVDDLGDFDFDCACYVQCMCSRQVEDAIKLYRQQARQLREQATNLNNVANSMRAQANNCNDPWDICWWSDITWNPLKWGKTAKELRRAANNLDNMAGKLRTNADKLEQKATKLTECCLKSTRDEQETCLKQLQTELCLEITVTFKEDWQRQIDQNNQEITNIELEIARINAHINDCNQQASTFCDVRCLQQCGDEADTVCYAQCFNVCYEVERNKCCREYAGLPEYPWQQPIPYGRDCDQPTTNCDDSNIPNSPKCGLSELARRLEIGKAELQAEIVCLENKKNSIDDCCDPELRPVEQARCMSNLQRRDCLSAEEEIEHQ